MQVEIVKWGNSNAVRLPAATLKEIHVTLGDRFIVRTQDGQIILVPAAKEYRLEDMVAQITNDNRHALVDFGQPMGREEAW